MNRVLTYVYTYAILGVGGINMSGKTSNESKAKYNKKAYDTHLYKYRKYSDLGFKIHEFKSLKGTSLNGLITKLLCEHFEVFTPLPELDYEKT
jgi:hypothetical protein